MPKLALLFVLAAGLTVTAVAVAAQPSPSPLVVKSTGTASKGKGTRAKPVPVSVGYSISATTADGSRTETWTKYANAWGGVVSNGKYFPVCTAATIDVAQSDARCPTGSLVGSGTMKAVVGPDNDFSAAGVPCTKAVHVYNAGQGKVTSILVGPASACAGVGYLPPFTGTWSKSGGIGGGEVNTVPIPSNVAHPLPGVMGSVAQVAVTFKKLTKKVKGVTHGYVESIGCTGKRAWKQHVVGDPSGTSYDNSGTAGSC